MLPTPLLIKYEAFIKKIIGNDHAQSGSKSSPLQNLSLIFFLFLLRAYSDQKADGMWNPTFFINVMALGTGFDKVPGAENHKEKSKLFTFQGSSCLSGPRRV